MDAIPEVSDMDVALSTGGRALLPKREELTDDERRMFGPHCNVVSDLFFSGGNLVDTLSKHGLKLRDEADPKKVMRFLRATLGDFDLSHEHKVGGIAHMLAKWTELRAKVSA